MTCSFKLNRSCEGLKKTSSGWGRSTKKKRSFLPKNTRRRWADFTNRWLSCRMKALRINVACESSCKSKKSTQDSRGKTLMSEWAWWRRYRLLSRRSKTFLNERMNKKRTPYKKWWGTIIQWRPLSTRWRSITFISSRTSKKKRNLAKS